MLLLWETLQRGDLARADAKSPITSIFQYINLVSSHAHRGRDAREMCIGGDQRRSVNSAFWNHGAAATNAVTAFARAVPISYALRDASQRRLAQ